MEIKLYTDGACKGNPGPGGYGIVLTATINGEPFIREHSGGYRLTTNNRMELAGVIFGLMQVNGAHDVEVISDSKYVVDAFNKKWVNGWREKGWTKPGGLANADMWRTLWTLVSMQRSVKFTWVKGHASNKFNNRCDELAVNASLDTPNLGADVIYEQTAKI